MALEVVANYLRLKRSSMTLIEPAFDNLADIFHRHAHSREHANSGGRHHDLARASYRHAAARQ